MNFRANIWHPCSVLTSIMDGIQHPRYFSGIKDAIESLECVGNPSWEGSANFITLDTTVMISTAWMKAVKKEEAMGIELPYHSTKSRLENQSDSMYGNDKRKQLALSQLWLEKDIMMNDAYFFQKLDFKHATVKDRHCRTMCRMCLVGKRMSSQRELTERLDIVWDTGGRLNKKDGLNRCGDSHVKDKTS